jgi:hypothetical protein
MLVAVLASAPTAVSGVPDVGDGLGVVEVEGDGD